MGPLEERHRGVASGIKLLSVLLLERAWYIQG